MAGKSRRGCSCGCFPLILLICFAAFGAYVFRISLLTQMGQFLVSSEAPRKADAVVCMAGDEFGLRILTSAELVKKGYAPFVLVSGIPHLLMNEADEMIRYAELRGYPASYFHAFRHDSDSTKSETRAIAAYLKIQGIHNVLLVTSNYHTRRAAWLLNKAAPWLEIHTVAAPDRYFSPNGWWTTRSGQRTFLNEWLRTLSAWVGN